MTLRRIVYGSHACEHFSEKALEQILIHARVRNEQRGITGVLLFADFSFLQVIEGSAEALDELLTVLRRDERHDGLLVLLDEAIETRSFPDWRMGYKRLDTIEESVPGFARLLESGGEPELLATVSKKVSALVAGFRQVTGTR